MKPLFRSIVALFASVAIFSCTKEVPAELNVSTAELTFSKDGGNQSISFSTNKDWTASASASWVKVTASGTSSATSINVTVEPNSGYDDRTATVTIKAQELTKTVNIRQSTNIGLLVAKNKYELTNDAQTLEIEVQANVEFEYSIDEACKEWIASSATKALSSSKVKLDIAKNDSFDDREGKIVFKQKGGTLAETVTISQSQTNGLFLTTSEYAVSNSEHDITVEVKANVQFTVTSEVDWIQYVETKALSTSNISLKVSKNETYDRRVGTVKVKQTNGSLEGVITITQDETLGLFVTPEEISISNSAQEVEVEVNTNVDFDIIVPEDAKEMITTVKTEGGETKALAAKKIKFGITENKGYDSREASVTFKQKNGELCGTVKIVQGQTDALLVTSAKEVTVSPDGGTFVVTLKSNIKYDFSITNDWIKEVKTKGLTEYSHTFEAEAIPEGTTTRENTIVFTDIEKALSDTVKILQQKAIVFDKTELTMICGSTEQITATVYVKDKTVTWGSSDKGVATVNTDGVVSAISEGQATITATTSDGLYKASCLVTVKNIEDCVVAYFAGGAYSSINGVISYGSKLNFALKNNGNVAITAKSLQLVDGVKKTKGNVMSLSDESILAGQGCAWTVTIGTGGIREPIAQFVYTCNGKEYVALCNMEKSLSSKEAIFIILDKKEVGMEEGDKTTITAEVFPSTAASSIVWSSGNTAVATVSDGIVTAVSEGETIITASNTDGTIKDECKVTVEKKSPIINFADSEVKAICVNNWDTSGDGELSEKEAAAVTSVGWIFEKNARIKTFTEFSYFTNVKALDFKAFEKCYSLKEIVLPEGITSISYDTFRECSSLASINIPEGVTSIGGSAFNGCSSLTSINIPEGVTTIAGFTFSGCSSLTSVKIPDGVTSIEWYAFNGCSSLASINIPEGVTSIGECTFRYCSSLTSINIPGGVTSIEEYTFDGCSSLTSVNISEGVASIGSYAFESCSNLTSINIPEGVVFIGDYAFYRCSSLTSVNIPGSVTSIGDYAFYRCSSLTSVNISEGVTSIGDGTFSDCSNLASINIPEGVTSIGGAAFYGCSSLTSVNIPGSVTSIGSLAFDGCSSLVVVYVKPTTPPSIGDSALGSVYSTPQIYVPRMSVDAYKSAWTYYADKIEPYDF